MVFIPMIGIKRGVYRTEEEAMQEREQQQEENTKRLKSIRSFLGNE